MRIYLEKVFSDDNGGNLIMKENHLICPIKNKIQGKFDYKRDCETDIEKDFFLW